MRPESRGAAAYRVFMDEVVRELLSERIEEATRERYLALAWLKPSVMVERAIVEAARLRKPGGWTDVETLARILPRSLHRTWIRLSYARGPNRQRWVWGSLHQLAFRPLISLPEQADDELWRFGESVPFPGSGGVVGIADFDPARPFEARRASTYQIVIDLAQPDRVLSSLVPGQSEHPDHVHYADGLGPWLAGSPRLLAMSRFLVKEQGVERLVLEPRP